ncbi:DUF2231 domain-containing protein [uncultured Dietzia sp.]|uniref:DUF2231 domain-containing protein n=1 Tax=uncultured Dietzia sp. TaxID=395519 RepID=UPI00260F3F53|nr:DUF2231 domain-containing protein [uncultured Dietzia sp.]
MNTIAGLPAHPLLVHAAVVLLPLAALVVVAYAVWPAARARIGIVSPVLALIAAGAAKLAEGAGESLERVVETLPDTNRAAVNAHAELGEQTVVAAGALVLVAVALSLVHGTAAARLRERLSLLEAPWVGIVGAVLAVIAGVAVVYLTVDAGHTGASMVWSDLTS